MRRILLGLVPLAIAGTISTVLPGTAEAAVTRAPDRTRQLAAPRAPQDVTAAAKTLHYGDKGATVKYLQQRLRALHYDPGTVDGKYGKDLRFAVYAFQRVNHISPSSTVGPRTWRALTHPAAPPRIIKGGAANRVEVSRKHQLVVVYERNQVKLITITSTGSGKRYCSGGSCGYARTPSGNFRVQRKINGWRHAPLGLLYKPIYFHGGYALHGNPSVPLYPASHGCARIPMYHTADLLFRLIPVGTAVYVR
ncbi:L,D-transpeptidase family protein [Actinomadura rupiterrae]|uniref:L,D-transpeptidase family protein n=1 Tax=Actinomadura rupiterrae TaxID=559627 RepID=UPI0020A32816|nr:L,D-transpeptidase family protein [Actinomadura rupiterrae]MCP2337603.1 peptidoglycan hydrolase-like protein with peptidoglycan-binding domain [Actinomadura rupiterrae]